MSNSPAPATTENKPAGAKPFIYARKNKTNILALWPETNPDKKRDLNGKITLTKDVGSVKAGADIPISGFIKAQTADPSKKFITFSAKGDNGYEQIAIANVVNSRSDDEPVYFDSLVVHVGKGENEEIISARLTLEATPEFATSIGFKSARIARPAKEAPAAGAESAAAAPAAAQEEASGPSY
jgi:hypothetical protein